ncbi:MAG: hypothetical protein AB7Y46_12655 [Armatimonadota bacterium]
MDISPADRGVLAHPSIDQMRRGLEGWQAQHPDRIAVSVPTRSPNGVDLLLCRVTEAGVPADDKQVVLITCTHAARELNATTSLLHFLRWLLGESKLARDTRARQIVYAFPAASPEAYEAITGPQPGNPCMGYWSWQGVLRPDLNPEAVAIAELIEREQPDVHLDLHGFPEADGTMAESTGISWASGISRPYVRRIAELMADAADEAGFGVRASEGEQAAGLVLTTGPLAVPYRPSTLSDADHAQLAPELAAHHFLHRPPNIHSCVYSYHRCHTLSMVMEIGFEQSALAQLQRLMRIGNQRWFSEPQPGYPTNSFGHGLSVAVAGYGPTARARRASRVELWRRFGQMALGYGNVTTRGELTGVFGMTAEGGERYLGLAPQRFDPEAPAPVTVLLDFEELFARLEGQAQFDVAAMRNFMARNPVPPCWTFFAPNWPGPEPGPIRCGAGLRLFLPYATARIEQVLLDGLPLKHSEIDGWSAWTGSGTTMQVNLPPGAVRDLHLVQCRYDPRQQRPCGFTEEDWRLQ